MTEPSSRGAVSRKWAEIGFAALLIGFGAAIIIGATEMDTGWGSSGPEAGYFPLRIGGLIVLAALAVLITEAIKANKAALLDRRALANMAWFGLPLFAMVAAVPRLGLYLAAVIYLVIAIGVIGRARLLTTIGVAVLVPLALFFLFEFVFRAPLPKGPLGPLLGMI